ncbi:MAG: hypothetical protein AB1659_11690 [Thermodesulfobacteriota bacterium]
MPLNPKEVICECGNSMTLSVRKLRCVKCGKYLFYDEPDKRRHRANTIYFLLMFALGVGFTAYFFIEMIVDPLFR